jgi:hypothetical protein
MSRRIRILLIAAIPLYLGFVAAVLLMAAKKEVNYSVAADISRDVYGFQEGQLGVLRDASRKNGQVRPASELMGEVVRINSEAPEEKYVLDWKGEKSVDIGTPPERWVDVLQGDDRVELVAFATWVPQPDDPLTNEGGWQAELTFRDPETLKVISSEELAKLGIPDHYSKLSPPRLYQTPVVRLLLRCSGMPQFQAPELRLGDHRTGARVNLDLRERDSKVTWTERVGDWVRYDSELLIWHNSPLLCRLCVLTGEPEYAELPQTLGAQIAFGDRLRVQWLGQAPRSIAISNSLYDFKPSKQVPIATLDWMPKSSADPFYTVERPGLFQVSLPNQTEPTPETIVRASSEEYLTEHLGWMSADSSTIRWRWTEEETQGGFLIASTRKVQSADQPMKLVFIPHIAELEFSIAGLPDLPNSGDIENLFDCVLPRISLPVDLDDAEAHLIGFIGVGAQIAWDQEDRWDDHPPDNLPADHTFRNETPRSLLNWYLQNTEGARLRYDEENLLLYVNEERMTWWDGLWERMEGLWYTYF